MIMTVWLSKDFTRCEALDVCKGALPGNVAKESGFDKSYLYYIYEASVEVKDNEESLASFREYTNLGYSTREFENKGIGQVSVLKENGDKYLKNIYLSHPYFSGSRGRETRYLVPMFSL